MSVIHDRSRQLAAWRKRASIALLQKPGSTRKPRFFHLQKTVRSLEYLWVIGLSCIACSLSGLAQTPTPIDMSDLPDPPAAIAELIESGRVTFQSGRRMVSRARTPPQIVAETEYRIAYNYSAHSRWRINSGGELVIQVRYSRITWEPRHTIWFRDRPANESFWSDRLVLHEFDHVRISNDRRFKRQFEQLLRSQKVLTPTIERGRPVDRAYVDRLVDQHVGAVFSNIADLISIRYKELDRLTLHGRRPIPDDSALKEWFQDEAESTD